MQTPTADYYKNSRAIIIIPYLIVYVGMTDRGKIYDIVMKWADKRDELNRLNIQEVTL